MNINKLFIKIFIILFIFFIINQRILSAEKISDPIDNSYIINNLKMESDSAPASGEQDSESGEIIFDNSFDDDLANKSKSDIKNIYKDSLKNKKSSDKRLHLSEYRVKRNENLWKIAKKSGMNINELIEINKLKKPELLKENDIILMPSTKGIFYKIKKGDTLTGISQKFKTEVDIIAEHNNIDGRRILIGKKIFIPDAVETVKSGPVKKKEIKTEAERIPQIASVKKNNEKNSAEKISFKWPIHGPITSGFGIRTHPFSGDKRFHCGLDIGAEEGTIVRSSGDGSVIFSGWKEAYGNMIVVSHKNNYITIYAHNSKNLVDVDEKVVKGQKIALSGKTGAVTGAHLHFEIRKGIVPLNPLRILK